MIAKKWPILFVALFCGACAQTAPQTTALNDPTNPAALEAPVRDVHTGTFHAADAKPVSANTVYTCAMHPEVISDKPGNCPKCGMVLVPIDSLSTKPTGAK